MSKNNVIIALVVLCLLGTIWGSVKDKKSAVLERQLAEMQAQPHATSEEATAPVGRDGALDAAKKEVEDLTAQNKELLANAATLKGTIASLKEEIKESDGGAAAVSAMQEELDKSNAKVSELEAAVAAAKADLADKIAALAAAEAAIAELEAVKSGLANSIDSYNEKGQELSTKLENSEQRVASLEKALEERTKLLVENGQELSRTKLNMNVLLSKIAAQNNSLAILEETRVALEKELAEKFTVIEGMQSEEAEESTSEESAAKETETPVAEEGKATE